MAIWLFMNSQREITFPFFPIFSDGVNGLLGNYDDNADNDIQKRDLTVLPSNTKDLELHEAMDTCKSNSLYNYLLNFSRS